MALKRYSLAGLCIGISAGLLCWLVARIDAALALRLIQHAQTSWLLTAATATMLVPLCSAWRWSGVLHAQQHTRVNYRVALRATMLANVLNAFLPSKSGDMAKALYLRRQCGISSGMGTVLLERMVDLSVLGLLGIAGYLFSQVAWGMLVGSTLLGIVAATFLFVAFVPINHLPLPRRAAGSAEAVAMVFQSWIRDPAAITRTVSGSLGVWALGGFILCALAAAIYPEVRWGELLSVYPTAILAGLVPATVSGIGTRDAAFVALLSGTMPAEVATLIAIGYTIFNYWLIALVSLPGALHEVLRFLRSPAVPVAPSPRRPMPFG